MGRFGFKPRRLASSILSIGFAESAIRAIDPFGNPCPLKESRPSIVIP